MLLVWLTWPIVVMGLLFAVARMEKRMLPQGRGTPLVPADGVSPTQGDAVAVAALDADRQHHLSGGRQ